MNKQKIISISLIGLFLISAIGLTIFYFTKDYILKEVNLVQSEEQSEAGCGEKPEFSEFLDLAPEEMIRYDPSVQELDAFNALLEEWNNCIDMLSWKTYRNEEFGFEFKHPKDWDISDFEFGFLNVISDNYWEDFIEFQIDVLSGDLYTVVAVYKQKIIDQMSVEGFGEEEYSSEDIIFLSNKATKVIYPTAMGLDHSDIFFEHNDTVFIISNMGGSTLENSVFSTFKFF